MKPEFVVMGALCALAILWCVQRAVLEYRAKMRYQAACVHNWERIHGYDDPRWPIDRCTICGKQVSIAKPIPCPHCGRDIRG